MKRFIQWLSARLSRAKTPSRPDLSATGSHLRKTGKHPQSGTARAPRQAIPERQPEVVRLEPHVGGKIQDAGPGKNVLIRSKYVREDTGTHETLRILDESMIDTDEQEGIDPYNTGKFDRSRQWDKRRS